MSVCWSVGRSSVYRSVCHHNFQKRSASCTSMLLSDHLFCCSVEEDQWGEGWSRLQKTYQGKPWHLGAELFYPTELLPQPLLLRWLSLRFSSVWNPWDLFLDAEAPLKPTPRSFFHILAFWSVTTIKHHGYPADFLSIFHATHISFSLLLS